MLLIRVGNWILFVVFFAFFFGLFLGVGNVYFVFVVRFCKE